MAIDGGRVAVRARFLSQRFIVDDGILLDTSSEHSTDQRTRVFLSYRRTDDRHLVGRLRDVLANVFGDENVFFDVDSITAGQDFRIAIREYIDEVDVMLALIRPRWELSRLAAATV